MRRVLLTLAVTLSGLGGALAVAPAAHAAGGSVCVHAHVNVNGSDVINQDQCAP